MPHRTQMYIELNFYNTSSMEHKYKFSKQTFELCQLFYLA